MSEVIVDTLKHSGNSSTANLTLASSGAVTTADDLTVGDNLIATKQNGCQRIILEQFYTPCDGSTIATSQGNITVQNVTSAIDMPESMTDMTGSVITYTPPTGATQVIYEYQWSICGHDNPCFSHFKLMLGGVEVTDARKSETVAADNNITVHYKWAFNIGGSAVAATGRVASWTSGKEIKWMGRDYSSSHDCFAHQMRFWEGADVTDFVTKPCIGITAIG